MNHRIARTLSLLLAGLTAFSAAGGQTGDALSKPLPIAIELASASADAATTASTSWVTDAIASALPEAGLASISRAPLLLQVQTLSRSLGESDAGMRRIVQSEATISLTLRSASASGVLGSVRLRGTGTGRDLESAASNALNQLISNDASLVSALKQLREQAGAAFEASCDDVLTNARDRANARDFDEALAVLMSVPTGAARCRSRSMTLATSLYATRSSWQCGAALQNATAAKAARRFDEALQHLRYVDPLSPCRARVTALLSELAVEASAREARRDAERAERLRREWDFQMQALRSATTIERQRLIVLGRIAETVLSAPRR